MALITVGTTAVKIVDLLTDEQLSRIAEIQEDFLGAGIRIEKAPGYEGTNVYIETLGDAVVGDSMEISNGISLGLKAIDYISIISNSVGTECVILVV